MNNATFKLKKQMLEIVDQITILAQEVELLVTTNRELKEENARLKALVRDKMIEEAPLQPREQSKRFRGVCIE